MTGEIAKRIVKGITDKIECNTADIDDWAEFWGFTREEYEEFLDMAIKALEQEPRWIPASERYPKIEDEYKYFLVTDSKGKVSVQEFFISLDEDPQPYFSGMVDVIAWMPLPTPYKPQESEET